jgi:hypothetical protein
MANPRRLLVIALIVTGVLRLPAFRWDVISNDEAISDAMGHDIALGGVVYRSTVGHKPPALADTYAAARAISAAAGGGGATAMTLVHALGLLAAVGTAAALGTPSEEDPTVDPTSHAVRGAEAMAVEDLDRNRPALLLDTAPHDVKHDGRFPFHRWPALGADVDAHLPSRPDRRGRRVLPPRRLIRPPFSAARVRA